MSGDRSVKAGGNIVGSAVVTGDHSVAQTQFAAVGSAEVVEALTAIRQIFAALPDVDPKALTRIEEAAAEVRKSKADRGEVKGLLAQAIGYAQKAAGFAKAAETLAPHLQKVAGWLGDAWGDLGDILHQ